MTYDMLYIYMYIFLFLVRDLWLFLFIGGVTSYLEVLRPGYPSDTGFLYSMSTFNVGETVSLTPFSL